MLGDASPRAAHVWSHEEVSCRDRLLECVFDRINYERLPAGSYVTSDFKLQRMELLLERLGNPHLSIPVIHVAGTKGKGTTATFAAALLKSMGLKVGLFTSPHIHRFEERMTVNGVMPSIAELEHVLSDLKPVLARWDADSSHSPPTFFEVCTAMAWLHFRSLCVDAAVLEVGLGGRLDATNICHPEVCVITSISRDHMHLLGNDLPSIAREKAGIIKRGIPVVSGVVDSAARQVVRNAAASLTCDLVEVDRDIHIERQGTEAVSRMNPLLRERIGVQTSHSRYESLQLPVPGRHHARNAAMALSAVELFQQRRPALLRQPVDGSAITSVTLPLKGEALSDSPLIIVDGAHNEASLQSVIELLSPFSVAQRRLVFGVSRDKDARAMLRLIDGQFSQIVLTAFQTNPRAIPVSELDQLASEELSISPWSTAATPVTALEAAEKPAAGSDVVCVTGSIFLGAEVRELLLHRRASLTGSL